MSDIEEVLRAHAMNGETPTWSIGRQRLFWIDVRKHELHLFDPATGRDQSWEMPSWIGCYGQTDRGAVVALRDGLFAFDVETGALEFVAPPPYDARRFTFNDGRGDPRGRFLSGTMYVPLKPSDQSKDDAPHGTPLWRLASGGRWEPLTPDRHTSNGLAWSPDGRLMYHSDTKAKTIWQWDYDPESGAVENRRVFVQLDKLPDGTGPDGASVDRDGFYWCAIYGRGCLHRYDPDGRLERTIDLPVRHPTMPAFGGPGLDVLYVTSANWQLSKTERAQHPMEGSLFAMPAPTSGLPEPYVSLPDPQWSPS